MYGSAHNYKRYYHQDDSDDELALGSSSNGGSKNRSINESLALALANADKEGEGDEVPEVLPAPTMAERGLENSLDNEIDRKMSIGSDDEELESTFKDVEGQKRKPIGEDKQDVRSTRRVEDAKHEKARIAMEEEERRVAALTFDPDALLPFENMKERAKYIPLRLTYEERKSLRTVNAAINVSDYTNTVDITFKKKTRRQHVQLQQIVGFLSGIVACTGHEEAKQS